MKKIVAVILISAFISSCVSSGHRSQSWNPHQAKTGKSYHPKKHK